MNWACSLRHPSMISLRSQRKLALLYFPAEHKYAVYTPLFASAVLPLFVAALREIAAWRRVRRQSVTVTQQ
jgi:phosphatidylinositol glycan class S